MAAFRFLTAGESHGQALGATSRACPAGLPLTADALAVDLARRQRGYGRGARQTIEQDRAEILAGVRHGRTLGSPILLLSPQPRLGELDAGHAGRSRSTDEEAAELLAAADGRQQAGDAGHAGPARATPTSPARSSTASTTSATCSSARPRARPTARVAAGGGRAGLPARARHRGLVVHRRGRRRGRRPGELHALARRGRRLARCAARTPTRRRG